MSNRWRRQYEGLEGLMGKMWCASRYFVYTLEKTFFFTSWKHVPNRASPALSERRLWSCHSAHRVKRSVTAKGQNGFKIQWEWEWLFVPQEVKLQHFCVNLHSILKYLSDNNSIFLSFVLVSFKPYVQSAWWLHLQIQADILSFRVGIILPWGCPYEQLQTLLTPCCFLLCYFL